MNSRSPLSTVILYSVAGPALLAAAFMSGCSGSGAGAPANGSGGNTFDTGGTTAGSGGTAANAGGATTSLGGNTPNAGGTTAGSGGTAANAGGNTTGSGGNTSNTGGITAGSGGNIPNAGGTAANAGGTAANAGGIAAGSGGSAARTGGTTPAGGATATGGSTASRGGASAGGNTTTSTSPGWGAPVTGGPSGTGGTTATVTVTPNTTVGTIGADYAGFSYEKTHIMNGSLTSNNTNLIALYKLLGSPMMRIGANDVEVCSWAGTGTAPSQPNGQPFNTKVTTGGVDQLCGFLAATNGSKVIYAVNYKSNNVTASAAEAAYVMGKCPSSIVAIEIGNELDKTATWANQKTQYESFATAILATPGAVLAGPASTSGSVTSFTVPFADSESAKWGSKLALLTQHSYVAGAGSTDCSLANLQITTSKLTGIFDAVQSAATKDKIAGWRMDENNTCSGHGQQNLSNTFISALWAIDYMFESAKRGASGINFHNGETGMDGTVPFYYEPIQEQNGVVVQVQPEYYGMLLFSQAGAGSMVSTTVTTSAQNFTAWAIKANGFTSVVLNNRNATTAVSATVNLGAAVSSASAIYLQGTGSLTTAAGSVTLAGAKVSAAGDWPRNAPYVQTTSGNSVSVYVPAASAALVRVQ